MATLIRAQSEFQGTVTEVWFECSDCTARIGDSRIVKEFKFCPNCGREITK